VNVLSLAYYKYTGFLWQLVGDATVSVGLPALPQPPSIALPIGISFFTFQAISYLIDVCDEVTSPARSYFEFATYHSLFPQLVAGPIVRYTEISSEMHKRRVDELALTEGAYRFCLGLGKKLVIADTLGNVVDATFSLPAAELDSVRAWIGICFYAFQLYYDFSGYSDMAIGLGRMLGFHFPENFDQPYRSASITEFWRRWHMTLTRWFRDYLYIPLGGNRRGPVRTCVNLATVFLLCGLWHGASLNFVIWGAYHGALLGIESGLGDAGAGGRLPDLRARPHRLGFLPYRGHERRMAVPQGDAFWRLREHGLLRPAALLDRRRLLLFAGGIRFRLFTLGEPVPA